MTDTEQATGSTPPATAQTAPGETRRPTDRLPATLRPLRDRNYALLFLGQLTSLVGDQLYVIALPFLVLEQAGIRELGFVLMSFGLARIVTVPIGGLLADRMNRARLMVLTDAGRAFCVLAVAVVAFNPEPSLVALVALTAVLGGLEGLFLPPSYAILPDILDDDELPAGNALNGALESGAAFLGPALAGLVVALFTPGIALAIDGATFVISAITLLAIRTRQPATEAREGSDDDATPSPPIGFLRMLATNRVVQLVLLITLFSNLAFDAMADVALPVFSRDYLERGAEGFGLMLSAFGFGALVGALLTDRFFKVPHRGLVALVLGVLQGVAVLLTPLWGGLVGAAVMLAIAGVTVGVLNAFYLTQVQREVPIEQLGRTMSVLTMAVFGAQPVSVLAAGLVLSQTGPAPIFAVAGLLIAVGYLLALASPRFRRLA